MIDAACEQAIAQGVYSYSRIKTLTERLVSDALIALDTPVQTELPLSPLTQSHPLIRQGGDYADLFTLGAQQNAQLPFINEESQL